MDKHSSLFCRKRKKSFYNIDTRKSTSGSDVSAEVVVVVDAVVVDVEAAVDVEAVVDVETSLLEAAVVTSPSSGLIVVSTSSG